MSLKTFEKMNDGITRRIVDDRMPDHIRRRHAPIDDHMLESEEEGNYFFYMIDFMGLALGVSVPTFEPGSAEPTTMLEMLEEIMQWSKAFDSLPMCGCLNTTFQQDWRNDQEDRHVVLMIVVEKCNAEGTVETHYGYLKLLSGDRAIFNLENPPIPVPEGEYTWRSALELTQQISQAIS